MEKLLQKQYKPKYTGERRNKGKYEIDGMTVAEPLPYLKESGNQFYKDMFQIKYKPKSGRRVGISKYSIEVRILDIFIVIDRTIKQAIIRKLIPIFELKFFK